MEALYGALGVALIVVLILVWLELIDFAAVFELVAAIVRLIAGGLFALGAFFVWLVWRRRQENKGGTDNPDKRRPDAPSLQL